MINVSDLPEATFRVWLCPGCLVAIGEREPLPLANTLRTRICARCLSIFPIDALAAVAVVLRLRNTKSN